MESVQYIVPLLRLVRITAKKRTVFPLRVKLRTLCENFSSSPIDYNFHYDRMLNVLGLLSDHSESLTDVLVEDWQRLFVWNVTPAY